MHSLLDKLAHAAGPDMLPSLGITPQESRLTQPQTGSPNGPPNHASSNNTSFPGGPATSTEAQSPKRQTLSPSRQPTSSRGQKPSPAAASSPAKSVGTQGSLSASGVAPLASATALGVSPGSRHASSPLPAGGQSTVQLWETPSSGGQGQGPLPPVSDQGGLVAAQSPGCAGARQMVTPVRERGVSPANRLTGLQKQNDALHVKLQVPLLCARHALRVTMQHVV